MISRDIKVYTNKQKTESIIANAAYRNEQFAYLRYIKVLHPMRSSPLS